MKGSIFSNQRCSSIPRSKNPDPQIDEQQIKAGKKTEWNRWGKSMENANPFTLFRRLLKCKD